VRSATPTIRAAVLLDVDVLQHVPLDAQRAGQAPRRFSRPTPSRAAGVRVEPIRSRCLLWRVFLGDLDGAAQAGTSQHDETGLRPVEHLVFQSFVSALFTLPGRRLSIDRARSPVGIGSG
jgi:hypothetical protein